MPRLLRPHIPLPVRCRVVLRQLGEMFVEDVMEARRRAPGGYGALLAEKMAILAQMLGAEDGGLRLDHHPALENRQKIFKRGVHVGYVPDANDPEYLRYMTAHAHHIKTQVRGEGAQFADNVIAKRERHRQKKADARQRPKRIPKFARKIKIPSRPFPKGRKFERRPK